MLGEALSLSRDVMFHELEAFAAEHRNVLISRDEKIFMVFMESALLCEVSAIIACKVARLDF